jgi:hypothetical protein
MPKLFTIAQDGNRYLATVEGEPHFEVARRVTYAVPSGATLGLAGSRSATDRYDPDAFAEQLGIWAYFIAPTALCESNGVFATVNTYDAAYFTWSFLQFGAHVANGDFVHLFRKLLALPEASDYFPDLEVFNGRVCRVEPAGPDPLESDASTKPLMCYFNPTVQAVEDVEVVNVAKMVHWCAHSPAARLAQVTTGVDLFRANMKAYARRYGLDGVDDTVCLVVADIRHQGRGLSADILRALATNGNPKKAYANLIDIGSHLYQGRCDTLNAAVKALVTAGKLGTHKYSVAAGDFVPR